MHYTDDFLSARFLDRVLDELHARGHAVDRREFNEFMASMSALIMPEGDSPRWWADAYVEATGEDRAPRVVVV